MRYLKIIEKSGYQALPWVRYITQNGGARGGATAGGRANRARVWRAGRGEGEGGPIAAEGRGRRAEAAARGRRPGEAQPAARRPPPAADYQLRTQ